VSGYFAQTFCVLTANTSIFGLSPALIRWRIISDLKKFGKHITDRQALDVFQRRSALSTRIITHRQRASLFLDILLNKDQVSESLAEETDGRPELARLHLPSQLGDSLSASQRSRHVQSVELKLRRVACLRALSRVRTTSIQKAQLITTKQHHARGEVANTRAQSMITRLSDRVDLAIWEYEHSREAMQKLGPVTAEDRIFKPLISDDLKGLSSILKGDRELGEGSKQLPWFWVLKADEQSSNEGGINEEIHEGM
jgi:hypothetical protein